jgi:hypothetical protein
MSVFVIESGYDYSGNNIETIVSTEEKAIRWIKHWIYKKNKLIRSDNNLRNSFHRISSAPKRFEEYKREDRNKASWRAGYKWINYTEWKIT